MSWRAWNPDKAREVGDSVWLIPSTRRDRQCAIMVDKVGRKWLHASGYRVDRQTGYVVTDYGAPGRCVESEHDAQRLAATSTAWRALQEAVRVSWSCPDGVDVVDIEHAMVALRLKAEK